MKKKSILNLSVLFVITLFFIGCDMTSSQKEEENSLMTGDVREIVPENQVVVRDYTRVLNTDLLAKIKSAQTRRSRGMQEDETSDFVTLQAEEELLDFYTEMPEELKIGFEEACANDDVKIEYHYLTTVELENQTDLTSDYIQAKIAEGEMLKEIENNFMEEDLILTANEDVDVEKDLSVMELYNDSNSRNKRINIKKYLSYRKPENSRSALASNEVKVNAASVVHFLALLNYQDEVMEIAKLLDKDIDIKKIRNYHKKLNSMTSRSSSSFGSYYDNDLITDDEIKDNLLKTGQIICRVSKLKSKGCIYGTYDHAGLIDLRNWTIDGNVIADNSTLCVFSAYPTTSKGDLQGDRMPEHLGYPSFEPLKNFTNGEKIAILEPLDTSDSEMEMAVAYTINKYDDKEDDINFMYSFPGNIYCSYMPYAGYRSIGINLNSDVKNQYPTLDCFRVWLDLLTGFPVYAIARACAGTIITPDDIYNSSSNQYGYAWFQVWVPTGYWSWKQTGKWWEWWKGKWKWTSTGGFYAWNYGKTKIYSKKTSVVLRREQ